VPFDFFRDIFAANAHEPVVKVEKEQLPLLMPDFKNNMVQTLGLKPILAAN
jgi:hypothetical protein